MRRNRRHAWQFFRGANLMTIIAPIVLTPTREELLRAMRKRHPRLSDARLSELLDYRLARGVLDVICNDIGEIDVRLTAAMKLN